MLLQYLLERASCTSDKLAACDASRQLTYADLTTFAKAVRRLVQAETRCERVGIMLPGSVGGLGTLLGVFWAGKTVVPLNFLLQPRELSAIIADARLDLVIATQHFESLMSQVPVRTLYLERLGLKRRYLWAKLSRTPDPPGVSGDDLAAIVYTSGTTGEPKGVCLSYGNLLGNSHACIEHLSITPDHHLLGLLPPFHAFGLTVLNLIPVVLGATITYIPRFSPQDTHRAIATEGITLLIAVPSMYAALARLKGLAHGDFGSIRLAVSGAEPLPRGVYDQMLERTGVHIMEGYGMTEASPVISCDLPHVHQRGTVGVPLPGVEVEVRDGEGRVLPVGQEGELFVRGALVMRGYFNRPEETAAMIDPQGWLRTGDVVRVDASGHIAITGRAKDVIIVGGENVYPREVEAVLEQHPAVADAAVVGLPDRTRGEMVVAFVTLEEETSAAENELRQFCRGRLAGYKVPRLIHVHEDLPRGPTGKVLKRELKTMLCGSGEQSVLVE